MINFSFCHSVFKILQPKKWWKAFACGKGLTSFKIIHMFNFTWVSPVVQLYMLFLNPFFKMPLWQPQSDPCLNRLNGSEWLESMQLLSSSRWCVIGYTPYIFFPLFKFKGWDQFHLYCPLWYDLSCWKRYKTQNKQISV